MGVMGVVGAYGGGFSDGGFYAAPEVVEEEEAWLT